MFKLIRRISYGVIPRADRPWEEDPTSNAPNTKRKRRLSEVERELADEEEKLATAKKARGEDDAATDGVALDPSPQADTKEVKDVTKGVDEVTIDAKHEGIVAGHAEENVLESTSAPELPLAPESVPLPEDTPGDFVAGPTPPQSTASSDENDVEQAEAAKDELPATSVEEASDIASSSGEGEDADAESVPDPDSEPMAKNVSPLKKPVLIVKPAIHPQTAAKA